MAILQHFKAKGSYGLYYGLGLDEIAVSFENISGLVNLAGNNGQGKTTFMEMLSPFAVFPSRQQKNPQKYNFKKQFRLRDSYVERAYLFNGKQYVFRVEVPAGTTMSPEGYITCDGKPLVKGKISEYKKVVTELFGSEKLFYSSIFSCQGGNKLTDLTVGDFKQLLIELLGLKRYTEYWQNVGAVITECNSALADVLKKLEFYSSKQLEIEKNKISLVTQKALLESQKKEVAGLEGKIKEIKTTIETLTTEASTVEKQEAVTLEKEKQLDDLTDEIVTLRANMAEAERKYHEWLAEHNDEVQPHRDLIAQKDQILNASAGIEQVRKEEIEWKKTIENLIEQGTLKKEAIAAIDLEVSELNSKLATIENDKVLSDLSVLKLEFETDLTAINQKIKDLNSAINVFVLDAPTKALEKELEQFKNAECLLEIRPVKCTIDDCPFIKDALSKISLKEGKQREIDAAREENKLKLQVEQNKMPDLEAKRIKVSDDIKALSKSILIREKELEHEKIKVKFDISVKQENRDKTIKEKDELTTKYREITGYLAGVQERIEKLETLAGKKADVETAERLIASAEKIETDKLEDIETARNDHAKKTGTLEEKAHGLKNEILKLIPRFTSAQLLDDIKFKKADLFTLERSLGWKKDSVSTTEKSIAVLEDKALLSDKDSAEIEHLKARETFIREELQKWSYIRDAVSKSGLQALEISAAAPLLTTIANNLLHSAYGGEFFLDLITQDPETGAEILDIMITRGDGESFPLAEFSGGESVWVLQAFKAAQILVNAEKSGVHFATCFADEESGALDKEKAEKFIQMYRALMEQGNFEKLFFISHIPECQAMADHSLIFQKGGIVSESDIEMVA